MPDTSGTWTVMQTSTWNQMQQNFTIYQVTSILLFFAILTVMILFKDVFPFMWARFVTHEIVVGVLDKTTRRITPNRNFKKHNGVFYYKGDPLPFVKVYKGNFMFAGLPFDILDVDLASVTDPRYQKACSELRKAGYPNMDALDKAILFSQMKKGDLRATELISREGYADYEDAVKHINPGNLTVDHDLVKQFFTSIPLSEMLGYGTEVPSEDILGEVDDIYEARKPSMVVQRELAKMLPIVIIIFAIAAAVVVLYVVFIKGK
jgi:hypothetical protein